MTAHSYPALSQFLLLYVALYAGFGVCWPLAAQCAWRQDQRQVAWPTCSMPPRSYSPFAPMRRH